MAAACSFLLLQLCLLAFLTLSTARSIVGRVALPTGEFVSNTVVALNGGEQKSTTALDGTFEFISVQSGAFVCDVFSNDYHFPQFKIIVAEDDSMVISEIKYPGGQRLPNGSYPLQFVALSTVQYETTKPAFSIIGMIMANPMLLLMGFSMLMVFAMPKLMQNMSPEELAEMQKQTAASGDPMKNLSKLMGVKQDADEDDD